MNFYEQLFKSISETDETNDQEDNNVCLITNETLEEDYITLDCGHKFNYVSIYNEVYQQKYKMSSTEVQNVNRFSIKCPYCREIQNSLLPPPPDTHKNLEKTKFVNFPLHSCMRPYLCSYVFKTGKKKGTKCSIPSFCDHCTRHIRYKKHNVTIS